MENDRFTPRNSRSILIIEPNPDLRAVMRAALRMEHYHVFQAKDGREASVVLKTLGEPLHLLVTELLVPGGNGIRLAAEIIAKHRVAKCLITSSYCDEVAFIGKDMAHRVHFLAKPFRMSRFVQRVSELAYGEASAAHAKAVRTAVPLKRRVAADGVPQILPTIERTISLYRRTAALKQELRRSLKNNELLDRQAYAALSEIRAIWGEITQTARAKGLPGSTQSVDAGTPAAITDLRPSAE